MPLHIDKWRGSPAVKAMHPAARSGYLDLLFYQWQSDDCSISSDAMDLADNSGLGDELWATYGARILRNFERLPDGRLRNAVCYAEWQEAKRIFEARKLSARRTNKLKASHGDRAVTDAIPSRSADTITGTITVTSTEILKNSSRGKREVKHSTDPRHVACKEAIFAYYQQHNEGEDPDWEGREGRALGMFLGANPKLTADGMKRLLEHRARSDVNHSDRPALWISRLKSFRNGPLDQYGKPKGMNGNGRANPNTEALHDFIAELENRAPTQ